MSTGFKWNNVFVIHLEMPSWTSCMRKYSAWTACHRIYVRKTLKNSVTEERNNMNSSAWPYLSLPRSVIAEILHYFAKGMSYFSMEYALLQPGGAMTVSIWLFAWFETHLALLITWEHDNSNIFTCTSIAKHEKAIKYRWKTDRTVNPPYSWGWNGSCRYIHASPYSQLLRKHMMPCP